MTCAQAVQAAPLDGSRDVVATAAEAVRDTGLAAIVVLPRRPGLVAWGRWLARSNDLDVHVEVGPGTIDVRFSRPVRADIAATLPERQAYLAWRGRMGSTSVLGTSSGRLRSHGAAIPRAIAGQVRMALRNLIERSSAQPASQSARPGAGSRSLL